MTKEQLEVWERKLDAKGIRYKIIGKGMSYDGNVELYILPRSEQGGGVGCGGLAKGIGAVALIVLFYLAFFR